MAEGERIGRAYVEIGADIEQLKQQLAQAESVTGASAERIAALRNDIIARSEAMQAEKQRQFGEQAIREREAMEAESAQRIAALRADIMSRMSSPDDPKSFGGSMKAAVASVKDFQQGMLAVVGTVSKTLGIAGLMVGTFSAIVGLGYKIGDALFGATREAKKLADAMEDVGVSGAAKRLKEAADEYAVVASSLARILEEGDPDSLAGSFQIATLEKRKKELEREIETAQGQLNSSEKMRRRQQALDEEKQAEEDAARKAEEDKRAADDTVKRIEQIDAETRRLNRESMDEKDRLTDEYNEKWDAIYKRMQEAKDATEKAALQKLLDATTNRYGDELRAFEDMEREKTAAANAEAEKRQKAESERMSKMAASYGAELSKAFQSADSANRAASDAMMERMATSINRLKEIAESNKQATNRGDTSTAGGVW